MEEKKNSRELYSNFQNLVKEHGFNNTLDTYSYCILHDIRLEGTIIDKVEVGTYNIYFHYMQNLFKYKTFDNFGIDDLNKFYKAIKNAIEKEN